MSSAIHEHITFSVQLAIELGDANLAMLVQFFKNTIMVHQRLERNQIKGFTWNYCTRAQIAAQFPFLSLDQVKRCLNKLINMKILKVDNFNKRKGDKTNWYAFVDEEKWGIPKSQKNIKKETCKSNEITQRSGDFAQGSGDFAQALPLNKDIKLHLSKVNDSDSSSLDKSLNFSKEKKGSLFKGTTQKNIESSAYEENPKDTYSKSTYKKIFEGTCKESSKDTYSKSTCPKGTFKGKVKYSEDQQASLDWLNTLKINADKNTLSWWARKYSRDRLEEVYRESIKRKPASLGAYMNRLLRKEATVASGRIEKNREFAKMFKEYKNWHALNIHQKYATIQINNSSCEIDFNLDSNEFERYFIEKYETYQANETYLS